jgi:hypothetical protein
VATFTAHLESSASLLELATRLGSACRKAEGRLRRERGRQRQGALLKGIESRVVRSGPEDWVGVLGDPSTLAAVLGEETARLLGQADMYYPLDCLAVLRGLLRGPIAELLPTLEGEVRLEEGMPVPFATRPVFKVIKPRATPFPETLMVGDLLEGCGARLYEYGADEYVAVTLDFGWRDRLDELGWEGDGRLPRFASIHPRGCGDLEAEPIDGGRFFDASPKQGDLGELLELLRSVRDEVEIAVLPELCLDRPDELGAALGAAPDEFPPLIVAGSAHLRTSAGGEAVRTNEAKVYLDGIEVAAHRKIKPFPTKELNGEALEEPLLEGLTEEPKSFTVLSGGSSRFGVAICADLNHLANPEKLVAAGVNLLAVPSFTPQPGAFNGPIADLASRCQGVAVVVNAPPLGAELPFHLMVAVPRPLPGEQTRSFSAPACEDVPRIAIFDPNLPLTKAVKWR